MTIVNFTLPSSICARIDPTYTQLLDRKETLKRIRGAAKTMIRHAHDAGLNPAQLPVYAEPGEPITLSFNNAEDRKIRIALGGLQSQLGVTASQAALSYLYAAINRGDLPAVSPVGGFLERYRKAVGHEERQVQSRFADNLLESLTRGEWKAALVEGATGIGKTLAVLAVANEVVESTPGERVLIAVPNLQIMNQFAAEFEKLKGAKMASIQYIVGRRQFVSVEALLEYVNSGTEIVDSRLVREWVTAGGPPSSKHSINLPFLVSSFEDLIGQDAVDAKMFPVDDIRLDSSASEADPGAQAYANQFLRESDSRIIVCTHAMLAVDTRKRRRAAARTREGLESSERLWKAFSATDMKGPGVKSILEQAAEELTRIDVGEDPGLLPPWSHLIVDEAHQFETNMAGVLNQALSLSRVVSLVKTLVGLGYVKEATYKRVKQCVNKLRTCESLEGEYDLVEGKESSVWRSKELKTIFERLMKISSEGLPAKEGMLLRRAQRVLELSLRFIEEGYGRVVLNYAFGPDFPSLLVSQKSIGKELRFLWKAAHKSVCVSATLFTQTATKGDSFSYIAGVLDLPEGRSTKKFDTVRPKWLFDPVVGLWTPENRKNNERIWLRPPRERDFVNPKAYDEACQAWLQEAATMVRRIYDSRTDGGILVLCGSYKLATELGDQFCDVEDKVVANPAHPIGVQARHFVNLKERGGKPIWFATGAAWTGLDINTYGSLAGDEHKNLVTDLVIPKLPFGLNRGASHKIRTENFFELEIQEVVIWLRQGLGRLVREEGLPKNRRIFVLDGRLNDTRIGLDSVKRVLESYQPRFSLSPDSVLHPI